MKTEYASVLQPVLFFDEDLVGEPRLYCRAVRGCINKTPEGQEISPWADIDFQTYFNSFSAGKWSRYTRVKKVSLYLELEGKAQITVFYSKLLYGQIVRHVVKRRLARAGERQCFEISLGELEHAGEYSFSVRSFEGAVRLYEAYYKKEDEAEPEDVFLALCFTTYHREEYIKKNLERLQAFPADKTHLYIADNGGTLRLPASERYTVLQNKNAGGAGGFARNLLQVMEDDKRYPFTHVVFMDDDVILDPQIIVRLICFLRYVRKEYQDCFVGGAMLRRDIPYFHVESGAVCDGLTLRGFGYGLDMRKRKDCMRLDQMRHSDYNAWWFCSVPISFVRPDNLPLPVFFQWDDVDYGLRNVHKPVILLNGICVWHEAFDNKMTPLYSYYAARNPLIVTACGERSVSARTALHFFKREFLTELYLYRYSNAEAVLRAEEDFLRGPDWLTSRGWESRHRELATWKDQLERIDALDQELFEICCGIRDCDKLHEMVRKLTGNGYFLPAKNVRILPYGSKRTVGGYRAKKIIYYDEITGRGYTCEKDWSRAVACFVRYRRLYKRLKSQYRRVAAEYKRAYPYLTSREMWDRLLT